jgi:acetolactate synthase-1/2/3 large subunit
MTGADLLVAAMLANRLDTVFTLPGLQMDAAFDALAKRRSDFRVYHTRHEQAAAYMADGYARVTGHPACCMVVPGPGLLNAMAGLATAYACSSPILCVAGQTPSTTIDAGLGMLHEIRNQLEMIRSVVKWSGRAMEPDRIPALVNMAFEEMLSGRHLPVEIEIPPDVLAASIESNAGLKPASPIMQLPSSDEIDIAVAALQEADRPLIVAGGGASSSGAHSEIAMLAERLTAPVIMTTNGKGSISARHGLAFEATAIPELMPAADVILAVGTRFAPRNGTRWRLREGQKLVRVEADSTEMSRGILPTISLRGDAKQVLGLLLEQLPRTRANSSSWQGLEALKTRLRKQVDAVQPQAELAQVIRSEVPDDAVIVDGMTQVGYWSRVGFPVYEPRTFISPGYQGTLGFELPTGLGAQVALGPKRRAVVITGDGGFMYNVGELATAVQHQINVIVVLFNDNAFGNVMRTQDVDYGGRRLGVELHNPDFPRMAETFGAVGMRATNVDEMRRSLRIALADDRPSVIEVPVGMMMDPWHLIQGH